LLLLNKRTLKAIQMKYPHGDEDEGGGSIPLKYRIFHEAKNEI